MPYQVRYMPTARRAIEQLPRAIQQRMTERIGALAEEPRPPGCVKLTGHNSYRIRVGDYRVLYKIADAELIVLVIHAGHRRDVYKRGS